MPLTALLRCHDLAETRDFYHRLLGATVSDTAHGTLSVSLHGAVLLFTAADLWGGAVGCSGTLYVTVANVDAYFAAVQGQVRVAWPVQDMDYGSREFGIQDCNGYHLAFQQQA